MVAYIFGSPWALPDVKTTVDGGSNTITLQPNFNTYNGADSFWSDGNGNGNKLMEANTYIENGAWNGSDLTFTGTVESNTLADGYTATYFIKALNPAAGFSDALGGSATLQFQQVETLVFLSMHLNYPLVLLFKLVLLS